MKPWNIFLFFYFFYFFCFYYSAHSFGSFVQDVSYPTIMRCNTKIAALMEQHRLYRSFNTSHDSSKKAISWLIRPSVPERINSCFVWFKVCLSLKLRLLKRVVSNYWHGQIYVNLVWYNVVYVISSEIAYYQSAPRSLAPEEWEYLRISRVDRNICTVALNRWSELALWVNFERPLTISGCCFLIWSSLRK